jgi:hypothetical protein
MLKAMNIERTLVHHGSFYLMGYTAQNYTIHEVDMRHRIKFLGQRAMDYLYQSSYCITMGRYIMRVGGYYHEKPLVLDTKS